MQKWMQWTLLEFELWFLIFHSRPLSLTPPAHPGWKNRTQTIMEACLFCASYLNLSVLRELLSYLNLLPQKNKKMVLLISLRTIISIVKDFIKLFYIKMNDIGAHWKMATQSGDWFRPFWSFWIDMLWGKLNNFVLYHPSYKSLTRRNIGRNKSMPFPRALV